MSERPTLASPDDGMTLIELLIGLVLLGLILGALFGSMMIALGTNEATRQRVTDSSGAQLLASYLVSDVASSDYVHTSGVTCSAGGTTILEVGWTDASGANKTDVTYSLLPTDTSAGDYKLVRSSYSVDGGGACSLNVSAAVVSNTVSPTDANKPVVTCSPSPCGLGTRDVTLQVTALTNASHSNYYSPYTFNLTGTRRVAS